jgi:hypothetical protein
MWHIGFAHWLRPATEVVKSLDRLKELRELGHLEISEWPAVAGIGLNNYLFKNPFPAHIVNCPTPVTLDVAIHRATR